MQINLDDKAIATIEFRCLLEKRPLLDNLKSKKYVDFWVTESLNGIKASSGDFVSEF